MCFQCILKESPGIPDLVKMSTTFFADETPTSWISLKDAATFDNAWGLEGNSEASISSAVGN